MIAVDYDANPWAFQAHPEVWLVVVFLVGAWLYAVRVIGPRVVAPGEPVVTTRQRWYFIATIAMFWVASDWPIHDIGEGYLYSLHMLQHMMLTYFLPPLAILSLPEWLLRIIVGDGRAYKVLRFFSKPVVAGVLFNL
ncbi:MAG TPA: cytochrome c oxidase assembly protein, partial [Ilumatobacteraceae bacterium]|nr:cytochrome c oxidase assembly protein [Ilumatobacteraceae bacterium]